MFETMAGGLTSKQSCIFTHILYNKHYDELYKPNSSQCLLYVCEHLRLIKSYQESMCHGFLVYWYLYCIQLVLFVCQIFAY